MEPIGTVRHSRASGPIFALVSAYCPPPTTSLSHPHVLEAQLQRGQDLRAVDARLHGVVEGLVVYEDVGHLVEHDLPHLGVERLARREFGVLLWLLYMGVEVLGV